MVISFEDAEDDFREEDADVAGEDRLVVAEFGLALLADCGGLALPLALEFELFFGSGLVLLRVDIRDSGMVMYCWTPSSLCS